MSFENLIQAVVGGAMMRQNMIYRNLSLGCTEVPIFSIGNLYASFTNLKTSNYWTWLVCKSCNLLSDWVVIFLCFKLNYAIVSV